MVGVSPFFVSVVSAGTSYYVSTTGDDTDAGDLANPFKTIQKAVNVATNGDTIYVMAGTYLPSTGHITITSKSASANWLTLRNYQNDIVIINGTNCPTTYSNGVNAVIEIEDSDYIRISGLTINHSASGGISAQVAAGHNKVSFIRIDNCTINYSCGQAFKSSNGNNNITFEYNYLYDNFNNWTGAVKSTQETISLENLTTFSINNNILINNRAENIDMKGGCHWGEVCYNEINNTGGLLQKSIGRPYYGGPSIMIDSRGVTHNISIYNNLIYGNRSGISCNTETSSGPYKDIYIYNNVINLIKLGAHTSNSPLPIYLSNSGSSTAVFNNIYIYSNNLRTGPTNDKLMFGIWDLNTSTANNIYFINNILYTDCTSGSWALYAESITPSSGVLTFNNNSYYRNTGTLTTRWISTSYTNQTDWNFGKDAIYTDPEFVDNANYNFDFHLNSTSPCIDTADDTLVPGFDYDGVSRPQRTDYDIGAYEYLREVIISSDSDFDYAHGVRSGGGTVASPFVINDWDFDNITVSGTTLNFTIQDCVLNYHCSISGLSSASDVILDGLRMDGTGMGSLCYIGVVHADTVLSSCIFKDVYSSYFRDS